MRLSRLHLLPLALLAVAACHDDSVSVNPRPPLGGVRFINAVPDGGAVDIRMVDQVEWSANSVVNGTQLGMPFRSGTPHQATEAKARHIRVFPTDSALAITTTVLHDTTITIEANKNVTLMLVGSRAAGGRVSFIKIDDTPPTITGPQIAVRMVNASAAGQVPTNADGYLTPSASSGLPAVANFRNVAPGIAAPYIVKDTGSFALRTTAAGSTATIWTADAPAGAPADGLIAATAGASGPGSALSGYLFPRSTVPPAGGNPALQGTPPSGFTTPGVVFFVDLIPAPPK
jgi:uncharacterized protein DUF4397